VAAVYVPRSPTTGVLYGVVRTHLSELLAAVDAQTDGNGLPGFVVNEFRKFLRCGVLGHGFARVRCGNCAFERLVPFSCKARAVCPSCGGRRMAERAAHLVDHVLPADVPVRQWVLSVPHRLRYRLAYDHRLCRTVLLARRAVHGSRGGITGCAGLAMDRQPLRIEARPLPRPPRHTFVRKLAHRSALPFSTASRSPQTAQRVVS